ncbi:MAG TPA: SDR family NAD(P)-dependent oxidoreductase [Flavipsychrobacter sp.]|nr:SDR family NAD(P)-dependent oxidoreductase [Flavipsychrobacter sp.]
MKNIIDKNKFGPWAIITGASSGIGKEFAHQLAASGFNLVLVARRHLLLEDIGKQLARQCNIEYRIVEADLAEESAIEKIKEATISLNIGLLISNAGTGKPGKFLSFEEKQQKQFVQLNALSHFSLTHHFGRRFTKRGQGGVLLTGAMGATDGVPFMASMACSKALLLSLGKSLHYEFKESGINITVLITTPTDTPIIPLLGFNKDTMPMKPITVKQCVTEALIALSANRVSVMPGRKFRIMNALVPGAMSNKMTGDLMKKNNGL